MVWGSAPFIYYYLVPPLKLFNLIGLILSLQSMLATSAPVGLAQPSCIFTPFFILSFFLSFFLSLLHSGRGGRGKDSAIHMLIYIFFFQKLNFGFGWLDSSWGLASQLFEGGFQWRIDCNPAFAICQNVAVNFSNKVPFSKSR